MKPICKINTVKTHFMDTRLIWTPRYYGQVSIFVPGESPYFFSKFNSLNTDAR